MIQEISSLVLLDGFNQLLFCACKINAKNSTLSESSNSSTNKQLFTTKQFLLYNWMPWLHAILL